MTSEDIQNLLAQGVMVTNTISPNRLIEIAKKLAPKKTEHKLIRLGPTLDGGYLLPDDLIGVSACFSPGVSHSAYFEDDLKNTYGINSHLADYSVESPPHQFTPISFTKKYLGAYTGDVYMTLESWVKSQWEYGLGNDLILQMDIEGAEYATLLATPDSILKRFRTIIVEIHSLETWGFPQMYEIANSLVEKLKQHFVVVHNHPNNWGGIVSIGGVLFPRTIEVTFHRKDRCRHIEDQVVFPHPLDAPCGPHLPDFPLPECFRY